MKIKKLKLEKLRIDAELSVPDLARLAKLEPNTIYRLLAGNKVRALTIIKLAKVLRCKPSDIMEEE